MDYKVDELLRVIFSNGTMLELMPDKLHVNHKGQLKEGVTNSELLGFYQEITPDGTPYIEFIIQTIKN